jgi:hypothetical protein
MFVTFVMCVTFVMFVTGDTADLAGYPANAS